MISLKWREVKYKIKLQRWWQHQQGEDWSYMTGKLARKYMRWMTVWVLSDTMWLDKWERGWFVILTLAKETFNSDVKAATYFWITKERSCQRVLGKKELLKGIWNLRVLWWYIHTDARTLTCLIIIILYLYMVVKSWVFAARQINPGYMSYMWVGVKLDRGVVKIGLSEECGSLLEAAEWSRSK